MTPEQIKAHIKALNAYEMSLLRNTWDDPDRIGDEQFKVIVTRSKLRKMLEELEKCEPPELT